MIFMLDKGEKIGWVGKQRRCSSNSLDEDKELCAIRVRTHR